MEKKTKKKSAFKVLVEALVFGGIKNHTLPTPRVGARRLSVDEIKEIVVEEFGKAKDSAETKAKKVKDWGDAELENDINWIKALNLKEFFSKRK